MLPRSNATAKRSPLGPGTRASASCKLTFMASPPGRSRATRPQRSNRLGAPSHGLLLKIVTSLYRLRSDAAAHCAQTSGVLGAKSPDVCAQWGAGPAPTLPSVGGDSSTVLREAVWPSTA